MQYFFASFVIKRRMGVIKEEKRQILHNQVVESFKIKRILKDENNSRCRTIKTQPDFIRNQFSIISSKIEEIVPPKSTDLLKLDLQKLGKEDLLFSYKEFSIYCVPGYKIPHLLYEIGRLREITFREVGEGTNKAIDLDEYDQYYHQLFIWDEKEEAIVGGYRIGLGKEIMNKKGKDGFYIQTLFTMKNKTETMLEQSMEMGRSFVVSEYQRKPHSLFFLWKGILFFLLNKPAYRYLIGPVSISDHFSPLTQQLIVKFIKEKYRDEKFAKLISSTTPFIASLSKTKISHLLKHVNSVQELDNLIFSIERKRMPVLLKKYLHLGGKIACFNVDPLFNNSLDGFLILDLNKIPQDIILSLSKDIDNNLIKRRFHCSQNIHKIRFMNENLNSVEVKKLTISI
jgi:putative hemolysin